VSDYRIKRASLTEQVSHQLQRYIEDRGLKPGDELPTELELTQMFGVSRTVIREGLSTIAALGLIETETGKRSRVAKLSGHLLDNFFTNAMRLNEDAVAQLLELRAAVEIYGVRLAAEKATQAQMTQLVEQLGEMDAALKAGDQERFIEADVEFHVLLSEMTGNEVLLHLIRSLRSSTRETIASGLAARGSTLDLSAIQEVHVEIHAAVGAHLPAEAAAAMERHFDLAIEAVRHRAETTQA